MPSAYDIIFIRYFNQLLRLLSLFLGLFVGGCLQTQVELPDLSPETRRLIEVNQTPLLVQFQASPEPSTLGHQFLFFIIPFGSVELKNSEEALTTATFATLALRGFHPIKTDLNATEARDNKHPLLKIQLSKVTLSGYDFFFFRKISASMQLRGLLYGPEDFSTPIRLWESQGSASSYERFAFAPELTRQFEKAMNNGLSTLFDNLGLPHSPFAPNGKEEVR